MGFHQGIHFEEIDRIAWITLNRRIVLNAVDSTMAAELHQAWTRVMTSPAVDAVVVVGAGAEAFCLGLDRTADAPAASADALRPPSLVIPLVAAVNGLACAEAIDLITAADAVVAAPHARFFTDRPPSRLSRDRLVPTQEIPAAELVDIVVPLSQLRREAERTVKVLMERATR